MEYERRSLIVWLDGNGYSNDEVSVQWSGTVNLDGSLTANGKSGTGYFIMILQCRNSVLEIHSNFSLDVLVNSVSRNFGQSWITLLGYS